MRKLKTYLKVYSVYVIIGHYSIELNHIIKHIQIKLHEFNMNLAKTTLPDVAGLDPNYTFYP